MVCGNRASMCRCVNVVESYAVPVEALILFFVLFFFFFVQAEDGIRDLVRSRGLGDVYKRQTFLLSDLLDDGMSLLQEL